MGAGLPSCIDISRKLSGEPIVPSHACIYLSNMTTQGGGITITRGCHILHYGHTEMFELTSQLSRVGRARLRGLEFVLVHADHLPGHHTRFRCSG